MTNEGKAKSLYFHYCNEKSCKGYDECTNCPNAKVHEGLIQMAEWKEQQMIEYLYKNIQSLLKDYGVSEASADMATQLFLANFKQAMKGE